jgi:hypothetical protein
MVPPMPSFRAPRIAMLLLLAALAVGSSIAQPALAGDCSEVIDEATARELFDGLARSLPSDGCTLEGVNTDRSTVSVEWTKNGQVPAAILVVPTSCVEAPTTDAGLTATVPAALAAACPAAVALTLDVVRRPRGPRVAIVSSGERTGVGVHRLVLPAVTAALTAAGALAAYLARRARLRKA